jgi:hypothetical protein
MAAKKIDTKNKNMNYKNEPGAANVAKLKGGDVEFAFSSTNYKLMGIGIVLLIIGFVLLAGGGSDDPNVFSYDIFDARRLVIAPLFMLSGFMLEIYAIMHRKKESDK